MDDNYFEKGNFKAWIYTVIRNEFINLYHKQKKQIYSEELSELWDKSSEDVLKDYIKNEEKRWLYHRIYELPEKERQVMILSSFHELSDEDIGRILNLSISNVRVIKHRVKKKLIDLYKKEEKRGKKDEFQRNCRKQAVLPQL